MFSLQGKIEAFHSDPNEKTGEVFQSVSLYVWVSNFNKTKPVIVELRIPLSVVGLDKCVGRDAIFPIGTYSKKETTDVSVNFAEDGRSVLVKNDKGEFQALNKRVETLKTAIAQK